VLALAPGDLGGGRAIRAHPARRRGGDQLRDVVPVAARERPSEREAGRLDEEMVLQRFWLYQPSSARLAAPFRLHVAGVDDCPRSLDRRRCPQPLEQKRVQPLPHPRPLPLV
jgi:hypothetical protein